MGVVVMLDWWWMMDWWVTLLMMIWREMTDTGMSDIYIGPYFRKVFMYLRKVFRDVTGVRDVLAHSARCLHRITWATSYVVKRIRCREKTRNDLDSFHLFHSAFWADVSVCSRVLLNYYHGEQAHLQILDSKHLCCRDLGSSWLGCPRFMFSSRSAQLVSHDHISSESLNENLLIRIS